MDLLRAIFIGPLAQMIAAPDLLAAHGVPTHPLQLSERPCIAYAYQAGSETWRFRKASGEVAAVRPSGPLRVNNGNAMLPSLIAGAGFGLLPAFRSLLLGRLAYALPRRPSRGAGI